MRRLLHAALALAAISAFAPAAGAGKGAACLAGGRKLAGKGLHKEALAAFRACLQTAPDDAYVESEIAAEALQLKDLELAEKSARAAVAHAGADPKPKAAALYDLGRVAEERHDMKAAIQAYSDSLAERSSAVVVRRLRALDPTAAAKLEKLVPTPLDGPYESFGEACKEHIAEDSKAAVEEFQKEYTRAYPKAPEKLAEKTRAYESKWSCECPDANKDDELGEPSIGALGKRWCKARVILSTCSGDNELELGSTFRVSLLLDTPKGWYAATTLPYYLRMNEAEKIRNISVVERPGGRELLWTFDVGMGSHSHYREVSSSESKLFVLGIGPSGEPSAVDVTLDKSDHEWIEGQKDDDSTDIALKASWNKAGQLVLSGKTTEDGLVGEHTLVFP
jgi:tetratricopeptide (TPR) repeat protein